MYVKELICRKNVEIRIKITSLLKEFKYLKENVAGISIKISVGRDIIGKYVIKNKWFVINWSFCSLKSMIHIKNKPSHDIINVFAFFRQPRMFEKQKHGVM